MFNISLLHKIDGRAADQLNSSIQSVLWLNHKNQLTHGMMMLMYVGLTAHIKVAMSSSTNTLGAI